MGILHGAKVQCHREWRRCLSQCSVATAILQPSTSGVHAFHQVSASSSRSALEHDHYGIASLFEGNIHSPGLQTSARRRDVRETARWGLTAGCL